MAVVDVSEPPRRRAERLLREGTRGTPEQQSAFEKLLGEAAGLGVEDWANLAKAIVLVEARAVATGELEAKSAGEAMQVAKRTVDMILGLLKVEGMDSLADEIQGLSAEERRERLVAVQAEVAEKRRVEPA